jgi:type IV fimbrial biogenesis protein FimT
MGAAPCASFVQADPSIVLPYESGCPVNRRTMRSRNRGLSLLEVIAVMGIVAILVAIGVPSYKYVTSHNRIAAEINGLLGDLQYAREEAIKEGQTVSVCVSNNGTSCLNSTAWQNGWMVFSDVTGTGKFAAGDAVLRVQATFSSTDTFVASNNISSITFNREGFANLTANGTLITLQPSPTTNDATRCLAITMVGMMTVQTYGGTCL